MTIDRNDPRWTSYVLNELSADERALFEAEMASDPDAGEKLSEARETVSALEEAFSLAGPVELTDPQRESVLAGVPEVATRTASARNRIGRWAVGAGIAASLLIGAVTVRVVRDVPDPARSETFATDVQRATEREDDRTSPSGTVAPALLQEGGSVDQVDRDASVTLNDRTLPTPSTALVGRALIEDEAEKNEPDTAAQPTPSVLGERQDGLPSESAPTPGETAGAGLQAARSGGVLTGTVMDVSGAVIPGVEVTALDTATSVTTTVITNRNGQYRLRPAETGNVELSASLPGFQTARYENIELGPEAQAVDFTLEVAGGQQTVDVAVDAQQLFVENPATVGDVVRAEGVTELPLVGNDARALAGVLESGRQSGAAAGQAGRTGVGQARSGVIGGVLSGVAGGAFGTAAAAPPPPPPAAPVPAFADQSRARFSTEEYDRIVDNAFRAVSLEPLSTFSIDVDTASYANVRRFLNQRTLPPPDAVRIEELINYFRYDYAPPNDGRPVRIHAEVADAPWADGHRLVRIGIQGQEIERAEQSSNLVFLIDVSGSMSSADKLPLLVDGLQLLVQQLGENDRVAIVVYAGASGLVLDSTPGFRKQRIVSALDRLRAGGSTNGAAGIQLAYDVAVRNFIPGGVNRVILATDGDFNVGVTNNGELTRLIEDKAETGVFLSVLAFGTGNLNDAGMEALADRGNGNYFYIDSIREARKVLVEEIGSTLVTIAKDVKIQVEFNPAEVSAYRLIGYENRALENQDFNNDAIDAGEIGSGHTVTALFEVVPAGVDIDLPGVDPLRYQTALAPTDQAASGELLTVAVRYKEPEADESLLIQAPVIDRGQSFDEASADHRFAAAVAGFGMLLRDSPHKGSATFDSILRIAETSMGTDEGGYRQEFAELVRRARALEDLN